MTSIKADCPTQADDAHPLKQEELIVHIRGRTGRRAHWSRFEALLIGLAALSLSSCLDRSDPDTDAIKIINEGRREVGLPPSDPLRGKQLFVTKGCFICHAVGGVGGAVAAPLDAPTDGRIVDPMVFAAAMWRGAAAMLSLQLLELGYQIDVAGDELRDLAAFASDPKVQTGFSLEEIPPFVREWMIDEPYWLNDDWPEQFKRPPDVEDGAPYDDL